MKRFITSNAFLYTAGLVFVFALWFLIAFVQGNGNLVFPSPIATFSALGKILSSEFIYLSIGRTLLRTLVGFGIAFAMALLLGSLAGEIKPLQRFFKPLMVILRSVPTAAVVFLILVVAGTSCAPIWIVTLLSFPILYESVVSGINAVPEEILWASRVDQGSVIRTLTRIKIPLATPYVVLGLLNSFGLSFKTSIMAEIITGETQPGLGAAITVYRSIDPTDMAPIFGVAVIAITIVFIFDGASTLLKRFVRK